MREGIPSGTSFLVSFARGLGVDDLELDPMASKWLPSWLGLLVDAPKRMGPVGHWYRRAIRATTFGMIDHMVLRTAAIDSHLVRAIASGIEQVVILGAGLDARAWRMPVLAGATIYEVDHPSTQGFKRDRIGDLKPPTEIRYVSVDLERERFSEIIVEAGFQPAERSVWIWEGVAMYLPIEAVRDSLSQLVPLAAPGSELLMTYRVPNALPFGPLGRIAIPLVFSMGGEALGATLSPSELESTLAPDWRVVYDQNADGWQQFSSSQAEPPRTFLGERLTVARREG